MHLSLLDAGLGSLGGVLGNEGFDDVEEMEIGVALRLGHRGEVGKRGNDFGHWVVCGAGVVTYISRCGRHFYKHFTDII
jgi:hypothetical protein